MIRGGRNHTAGVATDMYLKQFAFYSMLRKVKERELNEAGWKKISNRLG